MRLKSFLIIGIAMLTLVGCSGGSGDAASTPAGGAATPAATASKAP